MMAQARRTRADMLAITRAKLISAGRATFGEIGYADASMDEITAAVGLTRGALYHQFDGKKGLLEAVVEQIEDEFHEALVKIRQRSEEHTSELQSLMRIQYAVFCLKKQNKILPTTGLSTHIHRLQQ